MKTTTLLALFLGTVSILADDFSDQFATLKKIDDTDAIEKFLENAATKEAKNPNYYATAGNYWWGVAQKGGVQITPLPAGDFTINPDDLSIGDPKTGKKVGSIEALPKGENVPGKKAIAILSQGAEKFPHRADIALGLAHIQK